MSPKPSYDPQEREVMNAPGGSGIEALRVGHDTWRPSNSRGYFVGNQVWMTAQALRYIDDLQWAYDHIVELEDDPEASPAFLFLASAGAQAIGEYMTDGKGPLKVHTTSDGSLDGYVIKAMDVDRPIDLVAVFARLMAEVGEFELMRSPAQTEAK